MSSRCFAFRRTMAIGAVWAAAMTAVVATSPSASGQEGVEPGRGSAYAQGVKVDPRVGGLSFGITYGIALSGHQNTVAIAEARSLDLGVIGTTLAAEGCDGGDPTLSSEQQPQPLVVRSNEEGAAEGKSNNEFGVEKSASASENPLARAVATTAALGEPLLAQVGASRSETTSGLVDGRRVATAKTEIASISFGGGIAVLKGLRWEASWQSAPDEKVDGTFTIDGVEIQGQTIGIPVDGIDALEQINPLLEPLGIYVQAPRIRKEAGISFVDPLRIGIKPSELRDQVVGGLLGALQPIREAVETLLIEADCGNATYFTILDIVLNSVSGAGSLNLEVGGVTAQSDDIATTSFLGGAPAPPLGTPPPPATPSLGGDTGGSSGGGSLGTGTTTTGNDEGSSVATTPADDDDDEQALPISNLVDGTRGGPLVWIGLGGLLLLGALAEADRRRMRKAQRTVPMEMTA